jgi:hypothetical protein
MVMAWFQFWLLLHILAVIVAFGPTFAYPLMGAYSAKHPEAGPTVIHLMDLIEKRITLPLAAIVPLLGTALIYTGHFDLWKSEWLVIAIGLFVVAFFFAVFVQARNSATLVRMLASAPRPPEGAAPQDPPPAAQQLVKRLQMGGMFLTTLVVVIVVLMVWRPGSCQGIC